jgi:putative flavoprotein involved in K+ transport
MTERIPVVVVGAGPAGLSTSYELGRAGVEHVVLERGRVGQSWRTRWDSFCLVTPNWTMQMPGGEYRGDDPDGFMPRDEIVAHFVDYATGFGAPIREGVTVRALRRADRGFILEVDDGEIHADAVVLATGAFQKAYRPPGAASIPAGILAIDAEQYANPGALPGGGVLVVGSGQTGCQIAEELKAAGRDVVLACGKAPWLPRRLEGRDTVSWVCTTPLLEQTEDTLPSPAAKLGANFQLTGARGGQDLNYRTLQAAGVTLAGRFLGAADHRARFAPDLHESVAFGDARWADVARVIRDCCVARGERPPEMPTPAPFVADPPAELDLRPCGTIIFTSGFRPDYRSWVALPDAFDDQLGFPLQHDGASKTVPGLYFMGVHFLRKRKSSNLLGHAEDAAVVAARVAAELR